MRKARDRLETRRGLQKRETREAIQKAAQALFQAHGFQGTTIRAIATRAGVGVGTLHSHFQDKESLLLECLTDDIAKNHRRSWESLPGDAALEEKLLHLAREGYRGWLRQPSLSRIILRQMFFSERPELNRLKALDEDVLRRVTNLLEEAQDKGEVRRDIDAALATKGIFSFYLISSLGWLGGPSGPAPSGGQGEEPALTEGALEDLMRETHDFLGHLFQGIRPEKGEET